MIKFRIFIFLSIGNGIVLTNHNQFDVAAAVLGLKPLLYPLFVIRIQIFVICIFKSLIIYSFEKQN
jgi:hypothetical protein